jgi:cytosine/adenosine deaminase-related metal-dependent hydrolase
VAPVGEMLARGCRIAMGLDGLAFDEDEDALREMRLAYAVHKARGFDIRVPRSDLLRFGFENGRFAVTGHADGGRIAPGAPADLLLLDWDTLAAELVEPDVSPLHLLLAKATYAHIKGLFVGGREVVRNGALVTVDLPALEAQLLAALRHAASTTADIRAAMPHLSAALAAHYDGGFYCG